MGALTRTSSLIVSFFPDHFVIQDIKNEKMIGKGSQIADLYVFHAHNNDIAFVNTVLVHTWHKRLGHLSKKCLDVLKTHLPCAIPDTRHLSCYICHLAKQRRLSFVSHNNLSILPFDLIHCDIWGPYHVPAHSSHKYFLTLVDDCARFT